MAVPKRRTSKTNKRKRRTHDKLKEVQISVDQTSGEHHRSHMISPDGYYRGRKVLNVKKK